MIFFDTVENLGFKAVENFIFFIQNTNVTRASHWLISLFQKVSSGSSVYLQNTGGLEANRNIEYFRK